jgi:hypothetical protein
MIPSNCHGSAYPDSADVLYYEGATFRVEWYYTAEGRLPAYEQYQELPEVDRERLKKIVRYIADQPLGTLFPKTLYRIEDYANKIYAFKSKDERFFNFMVADRRIVITNAYRKHSRRMGKTDLDKLRIAISYRADYLRRVANGTYYENEEA